MNSSVVTSLNVEPGAYCPCVARFRSTLSSLVLSSFQFWLTVFGSKSGFETIAKNLSCTWIHNNYCTFIRTKCIISCFLEICIQCRYYIISWFFLSWNSFLICLQKCIGSQKFKVRNRLQTRFSLSSITDHMSKYIIVRIFSCLCPIFCHICLSQHISISVQNLSADHTVA